MVAIVKERQRFRRRAVSDEEARDELAHEPYKLELIADKGAASEDDGASAEVGAGELTIYDNLRRDGSTAWKDLCRGPHVPHTGYIPAFALTRNSAAYWRGDQKNARCSGCTGRPGRASEALKAHQHRLEEAAKRDHRKLGVELDLFSFPEVLGSGLAVFHPKGGIIRREMENYARQRHIDEGFEFVNTPHITKSPLFETSGHLPYFADTMFPPMAMEGADYYLKAMNCPMHNLIYASRGRSYRELPLRLFEFGSVYRFEKSGVVHGLTRVRGMTQDDSHSYCTPEQAPDEIKKLLFFVLGLLRDYGLDDFYLELSTRDDAKDKFIGTDEEWATATAVLEAAAVESGLQLVPDPGGAAFYGPKISVQARDAIGRTWQLATIQYDFNQPARFHLEYTAADGSRQQPVMIHSAKFGSIERFLGVLTEHYAGAFPPWLAPVQVVAIPVASDYDGYLSEVADRLRAQRRAGRGRQLRRPDGQEDPQRRTPEGALHSDRRRRGPGGRRGVLPLPRPNPEERGTGGAGDRRDHRRDRPPDPGLTPSCQRGSSPGRRSTLTASGRREEWPRGGRGPRSRCRGPPTGSSGSGRRTGWSTSRARTSRPPPPRPTARSAASRRRTTVRD